MDRKSAFIFLLWLLIIFPACGREDNKQALKGLWVLDQVDGKYLRTNDCSVLEFRDNGNEFYACGLYADTSCAGWYEGNEYTYSFLSEDGKALLITGCSPLDVPVRLIFSLIKTSRNRMNYFSAEYLFPGVSISQHNTFSIRRVQKDFSREIEGLWEFSLGGMRYRWHFLKDGHQCCYIFTDGDWLQVNNSSEPYHLYGDFLVTSVIDSIPSVRRQHCHTYDSWIIDIKGNHMMIKALKGTDYISIKTVARRISLNN